MKVRNIHSRNRIKRRFTCGCGIGGKRVVISYTERSNLALRNFMLGWTSNLIQFRKS